MVWHDVDNVCAFQSLFFFIDTIHGKLLASYYCTCVHCPGKVMETSWNAMPQKLLLTANSFQEWLQVATGKDDLHRCYYCWCHVFYHLRLFDYSCILLYPLPCHVTFNRTSFETLKALTQKERVREQCHLSKTAESMHTHAVMMIHGHIPPLLWKTVNLEPMTDPGSNYLLAKKCLRAVKP